MIDLGPIGQRVASVQDRQLAGLRAAEKARAGFLARETFGPERRRSPRFALAAAAAIAAAVAAFIGLGGRGRDLAFSVGDEPFVSAAGRQVISPIDRSVPIHFSDGSQAELEPGGSLAITAIGRDGAVADLAHGHAHLAVIHRASTRWALHAGPYTVAVVGTRFEVEWTPEVSSLVVRLAEGRVVVSGGRLASPVQVETGQVLSASADTWQLTPAAVASAEPPRALPDGAPTIAPAELAGAAPSSIPVPRVEAPPSDDPRADPAPEARSRAERPAASARWQQLASAGKYEEAIAAAERDGFDATCQSASAGDLMSLSEAARLGKRPARARQALIAVRSRFPGDAQASMAAFLLGRMSGDREAVEWFRAYLREAPGGALRREASGRLLEALSRSGDTAGARDAAEAYLKQYPRGPHAAFAEQIAQHPR